MAEENAFLKLQDDPSELIELICSHVAGGGSLSSLSELWKSPFLKIVKWIEADKERQAQYHKAVEYRDEWCKETLLQELRTLSAFNLKDLIGEDGNLLPLEKWPPSMIKCIDSIEVSQSINDAGDTSYLKKIKPVSLNSRMKAIETLMKSLGLLQQKPIELTASESLEELIAGSWKDKDG